MSVEQVDGSVIAIIGMSGRFPGARNVNEFWTNVCRGVESVKFFTDEELLAVGESEEALRDPNYVKAWPILEGIELFDAGFFGMSPRDAAVMDPQHRLFLEVAWEAMEDAGYDPELVPGPVGVFATNGMNAYMMHHLVTNREVMNTVGEWLVRHTGNDMNFLATRVSYQMNLTGPSLNVQTACSSSLVALHLACQSLLSGECDMALAGASALSLPQDRGYHFREGEVLSPDGHCRPFDAGSRGTLFGSGTGCIVLKRLSDALAAGDRVVALIRGTAINNDGSVKIGYLAPSVDGQARAIAEAIAISGVDAESISYIEAHGTGTAVGDPIEIAALTQAFKAHTDKRGFCAIGSVKANIGHLGEAAGIAGVIKTAMALEHAQLPPSINFQRPNPEIDFAGSPVFVNTSLVDWVTDGPRRAGVTSLGAGGTNAHAILEQAPELEPSGPGRTAELLVLSAKSEAALERASDRLCEHLEAHPELPLADVAHTLQVGRKQFSHRRSFVATSLADAIATLKARDPKRVATLATSKGAPSLVFMFPGGGAQYPGMGRELYDTEAPYRDALDEALAALDPELGGSLRALILGHTGSAAAQELARPSRSLPAIFCVEYAVAKLLMAWGLHPSGMIGHSMGEYVAAALSGVMSVKDALAMLVLRGKLLETLPAGAMLSVPLPESELQPLLAGGLSLAAVNAPGLCVVSGPVGAIEALEKELTARELECTRIHISVAGHSTMLDPILAEFARFCRSVHFFPPTLPFMSNLSGTWISPEQATSPDYWVRHLRQTVRFADGLAEVLRGGERVLLEIGPGRTLSSLARMQKEHSAPAFSTLRHPQEAVSDVAFLLQTAGRLWTYGIKPDFAALRKDERRSRVSLPSYPFERQRHWIERGNALDSGKATERGALKKRPDVGDWFYLPSFRRSLTAPRADKSGPWLVFGDDAGLGAKLEQRLPGNVVRVTRGPEFAKLADNHYTVHPSRRSDYEALLEELEATERFPAEIVHTWAVTPSPRFRLLALALPEASDFDAELQLCFDSLLCLGQALSAYERPLTLSVVSSDLYALTDEPVCDPAKALLTGPTLVIPREMPHVRTRNVDVRDANANGRALELLAAELCSEPNEPIVVLRNFGRFTPSYDPVRLERASAAPPVLRPRGVYLITGGLGGIGLAVAEHLARTMKARLVLVGRTAVPAREEWNAWIARHGSNDATSQRIQKLRAIEALGAEVLPISADVTSREQMEGALAAVRDRFGVVHGVIHSAGVIDDGLIAMKTLESAHAVIDVKARGALVLERLLADQPLDFFLVFSSVSSILGLEGQIDYTAANAFLDAFARKVSQSGTRAIAVNWNAWQSVGMAVVLADRGRAASTGTAGEVGPHPLLARVLEDSDGESVYTTPFSRAEHWLLSEHVVRGAEALIPGTGYLELARAALEHHAEPRTVELSNVFFLSPFAVRVGETRELTLRLKRSGPAAGEFSFISHTDDAPHVTGRARYVDVQAPERVSLDTLRTRCSRQIQELDGFIDQPFADFGPRWGNVRRITYGDREALLSLELPPGYHTDLEQIRLHPALLDMATGGAQALIPGFDQATHFYVPFSYGRLLLFRSMPGQLVSHVRHKKTSADGLAAFDVTLYDLEGNVLARIDDFVMRRVEQASVMAGESAQTDAKGSTMTRLGSVVHEGISPKEGMDALDRILSAPVDRQVIASSVSLEQWRERIDAEARARNAPEAASDGEASAFARPELSTRYVAPRDDVERELAALWRELLGLGQVGINDDFFEVGGQSLIAVRLFNKIRKRYDVDLPLSVLFEAPTIAACAEIIRDEAGLGPLVPTNGEPGAAPPSEDAAPQSVKPRAAAKKARWGSLVAIQPNGALPPFFCVAGMGGTLGNLRSLALLIGTDRPFYGLQPPGADDPKQRLYRVEDLAAHYIAELRNVQPHGPYFVGGYSGGGVAAFEMAKQLEHAGEAVAFLGFLDSFSPSLPLRPLKDRALIHLRRARAHGPTYVTGALSRRLGYERTMLTLRVQRELGKLFPERYRYENLQDSWVVAEAHYEPDPWSGRAILFRAREETALSLWTAYIVDEKHGWGRYVRGGVDVVICDGNHTTMCEEPFVRDLAQKLRAALDRETHVEKSETKSARAEAMSAAPAE